jgi:hypothetical protein
MDCAGTSCEPLPLELAIVPPDFKRQKVPLEKGCSQMDWLRLKKKGVDLDGKPLNGVNPSPTRTLLSAPEPQSKWMIKWTAATWSCPVDMTSQVTRTY